MSIIPEIIAALGDEWRKPCNMPNVNNHRVDECGNSFTIQPGETLYVEFEYALPGIVETLHLDPSHGPERIARVIAALATPDN